MPSGEPIDRAGRTIHFIKGLLVSAWDERVHRYVSKGVDTLEDYARLHEKGLLEYQREGLPRPAHYPDLD